MRNFKRSLRFARSKCGARAALRSKHTGQNSIAPENSLPQLGQVRWGSAVIIYPPVLSPRSFAAWYETVRALFWSPDTCESAAADTARLVPCSFC
jgi:hypothetical protein